ncbi:MAG: TlpA family protein disulfide reductase [Acidobacteriota bacterium]|nr:MAG: TlpA family protein disulfide reductase [Acidobacteriota bacterium]
MSKSVAYRTLIAGVLSPILSVILGVVAYSTLTRASADRDADFVFRLTMTTIVMLLPFALTLLSALVDQRRAALTRWGKVGVVFAILSLGLAWLPVKSLYERSRQADNLALSGVEAPTFDTIDIHGTRHRLADHSGKVILINIWATWCSPCLREIPELDRLYKERRDDGFMIFGISKEDALTQKGFAERIEVSYPLLTVEGEVPEIYTQTARYPASFLIDRQGNLRPAPSVDEPFENLEAAVEGLLKGTDDGD